MSYLGTLRSFSLSTLFLNEYKDKQPDWGYNGLGYVVYKRTYSRTKEDGTLEEFWETCARVVEGTYDAQKKHCKALKLQWDDRKSQRSAQEMYKRMWAFKWLPSGRGLWMMGSENVDKIGSAALNSCGMVSTAEITVDFAEPFCWLMDMLMLGVGIGFDTKGAGLVKIHTPQEIEGSFVVEDSREGWVALLRTVLTAYATKGGSIPSTIDYSKVRPAGVPIAGFGGVASGPQPLIDLIKAVRDTLDALSGNMITTTAIVDISDFVGRCVVSGNVRRCLPAGTPVHTSTGLVPIEKVLPGAKVQTSQGWKTVLNNFNQGVQSVSSVKTQLGEFQATGNHRMKVFVSPTEFAFKQMSELVPGDRLVFNTTVQKYENTTELPSWSYVHPVNSTTCKDLKIPALTQDVSWFLGLLAGDGYVAPNFDKKGFNAYVSVACSPDYPQIISDCQEVIKSFGVNLCDVLPKITDNCYKVRTQSKQLAWYLSQFKKANEVLHVPQCVVSGSVETRGAYVAGLFDADGSCKTRPLQVAVSVYPTFLEEVQALLSTLGIASRLKLTRKAIDKWKPLYSLDVVGETQVPAFEKLIAVYSRKYRGVEVLRGQNDYGFPASWMGKSVRTQVATKGWANNAKQMTVGTYQIISNTAVLALPITVISVTKDVACVPTYDLEVADVHEFVAGPGLVVHNSALLSLGGQDDQEFLDLKNPDINQEALMSHRWSANHSIAAEVGMDYSKVAAMTAKNGEPGYVWLDNARKFSRMDGPPDFSDMRVVGVNPCSEQSLENMENCNLVETFPSKHENFEDYKKTLKYAYLYAKTVTLIPTHSPRTNMVMMRNRRIGCSMSGIVQAMQKFGRRKFLSEFCDQGYKYLRELDVIYSDWLCIRPSIKITTVKPSGSVSLLSGVTPGIHFPHSHFYKRRVRLQVGSTLVEQLIKAGYEVEPDKYSPNTMVATFPVEERDYDRSKSDITLWEQLEMAAQMQEYWADNQVSVTVTFTKEEAKDIKYALELYETRLKGVSFLPISDHGYAQAPYETVTEEEYKLLAGKITQLSSDSLEHEVTTKYCDGDQCTI